MGEVTRTVILRTAPLPRKVFRVFVELEGMYRNMVEQLVLHAVRSGAVSFAKLKALKYRELRALYPHLPSHYAYTACQDASARAKSFLRLKRRGLAERDHPEVRRVSIWLDDHLWRPKGLATIEVATHEGWVRVELELHKQYWRYVNGGWKLASESKVRLDRRERRLIAYLTFKKTVGVYKPEGFMPVDVNENHAAVLVEGKVYLFETDMEKLVLGYYYRRRRVQEKYDKLYGAKCRAKRKILRKLKEGRKKNDLRWKLAHIIVRAAKEKQYAVVLEELGRNSARGMIKHVKDSQLRHRIYQASFRGVQKAIEEKARECGVPVVHVDPKNTSKLCPVHGNPIAYNDGSRVGRCTAGGELWHRDVAACVNLLLRARPGDGSNAPSLGGSTVDGGAVPLRPTAAHEPSALPKGLWARWKSLPQTLRYGFEQNEAVGINGCRNPCGRGGSPYRRYVILRHKMRR